MERMQTLVNQRTQNKMTKSASDGVPYDLNYFIDLHVQATEELKLENPKEEVDWEEIKSNLLRRFVWFEAEKKGYFMNAIEPRRLVGQELYDLLIVVDPKEKERVDKAYGVDREGV